MSRHPSLTPRTWAVVVLLAALLAAGLQWGPERIRRWRADRTATRFVAALHDGDTAALSGLTPGGRTRNVLCARRTWPAAYWSRAGRAPAIEHLPPGMDIGYRVVGDTLPDLGKPAEFLIFIVAERPGQVDRYFANLRGRAWDEPFRTCVRGG